MMLLIIGSLAQRRRLAGYNYWTDGRFLISTDDAYVRPHGLHLAEDFRLCRSGQGPEVP
jgi:multidrug resistance efflux pump